MTSIIEYFQTNGLNYTAVGSSYLRNSYSSYNPYNVFVNNSNMFHSSRDSPCQWWQISFEIPVAITSYTIFRSKSNNCYPNRWGISYSMDGESFTHLQEDSGNTHGNVILFSITKQFNCKHFRITAISNFACSKALFFDYFNCYGTAGTPITKTNTKTNRYMTCNFVLYRQHLISNALLVVMISIINT